MGEPSFADSGAGVLEEDVRRLAPGVRVVHTVFRPFPLEPITGRRVFFVTTAPAPVVDRMTEKPGARIRRRVVGTSAWLADRQCLAADLDAMPDADVLLVGLKAAAVGLAVQAAHERGMEVTFCDNRLVSTGGNGTFDELASATADLAVELSTQIVVEAGPAGPVNPNKKRHHIKPINRQARVGPLVTSGASGIGSGGES